MFYRLISTFKHHPRHHLIYIASSMIFFWVIFDGILSYFVPILITDRGYSQTQLGFIMSFSSIAGAAFDFLLSKYLKNTIYLKTFLLIIAISFLFPLVLWYSTHIFLYLLAMAIWGLYYDLYSFASYDFVSRDSHNSAHYSTDFGIIELFRSLGGVAAPLIGAWILIDQINISNMAFPYIFLIVAGVFYIFLFINSPLSHFHKSSPYIRSVNSITEIKQWLKIGSVIFPVLLFMICMQIFDAVFWTIGPLFSDSFPNFHYFSGILMTLYNLPALFTAWKVESATQRFGKKRTAYFSFLLASLVLIPIGYLHSPYLILLCVFLSSIAISFTWPAIESAVADYVAESKLYKSEIEGLSDFTANLGYIIGPIFAGILSDKIGIGHSFSILGIFIALIIVILLIITPKHINVKNIV
jgi:MFS family permease